MAYAVSGCKGSSLVKRSIVDPDAPYMLQDDAKTNRCTPASARELAQTHGRVVVDRKRQRLVELADRVVRERGEVDDRVEAVQVLLPDVADVNADVRR